MDTKVKQGISAGVNAYAGLAGLNGADLLAELDQVFVSDSPFLDKVQRLDQIFDDSPRFEELREVCFDLLMINFFAQDVQKLEEDYLESSEWESIEEQTLDRGTELLNVFLYLRECADEDVEPSLEDYLKEFLLVEEDEFQDEHSIYERVIANQVLVESDYSEIAKVARSVGQEEELYELFYPIVSFFYEQDPDDRQLEEFTKHAANKDFETAVYQVIVNFNK